MSGQLPNQITSIGVLLSIIGVTGVAMVGWTGHVVSTAGMYLAFSCLPGVILSTTGHVMRPSRAAKWGIAGGILGSLYLATFWLAMTH